MSQQEERGLRVARRAAPLVGLATLCFIVSRFVETDTQELLVGLTAVFGMLAASAAVFSWFDKSGQ